jgi:hypothetical protein
MQEKLRKKFKKEIPWFMSPVLTDAQMGKIDHQVHF